MNTLTRDEIKERIKKRTVDDDVLKAINNYLNTDDLEFVLYIGINYYSGNGLPKNQKLAFKFFKFAADASFSRAIPFVAYCYRYGCGVDKDYKLALDWYKKGAELGNTNCMCKLAEEYLLGDIVEVDVKTAKMWYEKGASLGDGSCIRALNKYHWSDEYDDKDK